MSAKKQHITALRPFLEGTGPNEKGEWDLHCPLHDDVKRSASVNLDKGKWYCHACQVGGGMPELLEALKSPFVGDVHANGTNGTGAKPLPSEGSVHGWHAALMSNRPALHDLQVARGLNVGTLTKYQIGWDDGAKAYTIPVRNDDGELVNVRWYDLNPRDKRRKIWGVTGHNSPVLYPLDQLEYPEVVICEGEWDALLSIQSGIPAITRTGAAKVWNSSWNERFRGKKVYICHDRDTAGREGNRKVYLSLRKVVEEIFIAKLPYPMDEKHGKDLTDYWMEGNTVEDFLLLLKRLDEPEEAEPSLVSLSVLDSFSADQAGKTLRMRVTITGKRTPTFLVPDLVEYNCTQDAGPKCAVCPMNELGGNVKRSIPAEDPIIMEFLNSSHQQVKDLLRRYIGAQKCAMLTIETVQPRAVEELSVRPSVEIARIQSGEAGQYTNRSVISVGRHDTLPNNTVEIVGSIFPNPRTQHNEFQAWDLERTETSVDKFVVDDHVRRLCSVFQPGPGEALLTKLGLIASDMATSVTKIYGRKEMHAALDLVWHSPLQFEFGGDVLQRGWLELLIVGDTRTGKSEAAQKMLRWYEAGEMVSCESVTFSGVVGGLQQVGANRQWEVTWGAVPLNDRRLVVLDEVSGMAVEQIAQMSSIRSSGEAQLTKIRSERTWARTRLIWMGNPRDSRMADYTYGVQAVPKLIGNPEDIARFDLAMSISAHEVDAAQINRDTTGQSGVPVYGQEAGQALLRWAWSRRAEHVRWEAGAQSLVYENAIEMGGRYVETPPLIQAANVRVKLARLSVAMAIRLYSTDGDGELVLVTKRHVRAAVRFLDLLYSMPSFGYSELSKEKKKEISEASQHYDEAKQYVSGNTDLAKFLRGSEGHFRSQDLQDMMNLTREMANAMINTLWRYRMISRDGANIKIQPLLHEILREVR